MENESNDLPLIVRSTAFNHNTIIPSKYTCDGENISPPLSIENIPNGTHCLALIMEDPDAPEKTFDHWVVWNIPPIPFIWENTFPGTTGKNSKGELKYTGPCPPNGKHRYFFKIFALDASLFLHEGANKESLKKAMQSHIIATAELVGLYS